MGHMSTSWLPASWRDPHDTVDDLADGLCDSLHPKCALGVTDSIWTLLLCIRIFLPMVLAVLAALQYRQAASARREGGGGEEAAPAAPPKRSSECLDSCALDGLRGFATLHIMLYHLLKYHWTSAGTLVPLNLLGESVMPLWYALSGFVLAFNHIGHLDAETFLVRRFARLFPCFFVNSLFSFVEDMVEVARLQWGCPVIHSGAGLGSVPFQTFGMPLPFRIQQPMDAIIETARSQLPCRWWDLTQGRLWLVFFSRGSQPILGAWPGLLGLSAIVPRYQPPAQEAWAVSMFLCWYIIYPLVAPRLPTTAAAEATRSPAAACATAHRLRGHGLACLAAYAAASVALTPHSGFQLAYAWFPPALPIFLLGAIAAVERTVHAVAAESGVDGVASLHQGPRGFPPPRLPFIPSPVAAGSTCFLGLAACVVTFWAFRAEGIGGAVVTYAGETYFQVRLKLFYPVLMAPAFYLAMLGFTPAHKEQGTRRSLVLRFLRSPPMQWLGEKSLALYLSHVRVAILLVTAFEYLRNLGCDGGSAAPPFSNLACQVVDNGWVRLVAAAATSGWVATIAGRLIEGPSQRAICAIHRCLRGGATSDGVGGGGKAGGARKGVLV